MGTIKDTVDLGLELLQFWAKFQGRRVRVWPSDLTLRICSESHRKWVTSPDSPAPSWWALPSQESVAAKTSRESTLPEEAFDHAVDHLTGSEVLHLESVQEARLFEGRIDEVVKQPPGLLFTDIYYWMSGEGGGVTKVKSTDEEIFLPFSELARIDFVSPSSRQGSRRRSGSNS